MSDIRVSSAKKKAKKKQAPSTGKICDWRGCGEAADFRAPRSRDQLNTYYWFCKGHIRDYNSAWNFFDGMSEGEVREYIDSSSHGHRPTWKMGGKNDPTAAESFADPHGVFKGENNERTVAPGGHFEEFARRPKLSKLDRQALSVLDLDEPVTLHQVKTQYKQLVKRFHPDLNGGDRTTEERLKTVIQAYGQLKKSGALDKLTPGE